MYENYTGIELYVRLNTVQKELERLTAEKVEIIEGLKKYPAFCNLLGLEPYFQLLNRDSSIEKLGLTKRALNLLTKENIYSIFDLTERTALEISSIPNLGEETLKKIQETLTLNNLRLKNEE